MSYANTAHCDNCDRPKGQTNHWLQVRVHGSRIIVEPLEPKSHGVQHACGDGCAIKLVSVALAKPAEPIEFPILSDEEVTVCEQAKSG